ncbi:uncharacterized protein LOC117117152 [Anneissia japonica]|uniref:uncharacterized protein LOC117117152 n=1 Tax=Anneissia japonica TaxID=1529436 RepID=UPI0014258573|nr:uncharacterized protein LOC117117152 [Anneissia japonica]
MAFDFIKHLKPDVEIFFQDPADILKKHLKQVIQILEFQQKHKQLLASHRKQEILKQNSMLAEARKRSETLDILEREIKLLTEENNHLRSLLEESPVKRRCGTPGRILQRTSPLNPGMASRSVTPSPILNSPYTLTSKLNRSQDGNHTPQMIRTPQGPARISLRTPPINGRLGTTPGNSGTRKTPSGYPKRPSTTPGRLLAPTTPGLNKTSSPMITSPMYNRSGGDGFNVSGRDHISSSQSQFSQMKRYMMDNRQHTPKYGDTNKKPIQLSNTRHQPLISTPLSSQIPRM